MHVMMSGIGENEEEERLDEIVQKFWKLDSINVPEESDVDIFSRFKETLEFKNGRVKQERRRIQSK